jgi:hypothetical protein
MGMTADNTQSLAEFLLARIDEDEDAGRRDFGPDETVGTWTAWVLADCEAKRRIIYRVQIEADSLDDQAIELRDYVLEQLALPYADYPDYQPEWRP